MGKIPTKRGLAMLVTLFVLGVTLSSAQKVNLNFSQKSLRTVLESITEQTSHTLAFSKEAVDLSEVVSIRVTDGDLVQVLNQLLTPRHIGYEIRDNKIYIFDQPATTVSGVSQTQQKEVTLTGTVTDLNGEPIIGANIVVPGTTIGTVTNVMELQPDAPQGSMLRFSYIGYLEQEYRINNQTVLNVQLSEDVATLDELIVVGYGVQRKSVVTAAISKVSSEELNVTRPTRVEDALKGKVSGVQITQSSGQPAPTRSHPRYWNNQ